MTDAVAYGAAPLRVGDVGGIAAPGRKNAEAPVGFVGWLLGSRQGLLTIWAITAFLCQDAIVFWHAFRSPILDTFAAKASFAAATSLLWLPLLLLFLDPQDNLSKGPRLALPLLCLAILGALTVVAIVDQIGGRYLLGARGSSTGYAYAARAAFLSFLSLAFIPQIWNAANFARYAAERREATTRAGREVGESIAETRDAEAMGALVATISVLAIGLLAYLAGASGDGLSIEHTYGLVLGGVVIGVFAIVVFLDKLSELALVRGLSRAMRIVSGHAHFLAAFYNWIDTGLVRIGAGVVGMGHENAIVRYSVLAGSLGCLCLLGWFLPPPLGLAPCLFAFVFAVSVSRLWSWVEDDRALAAMTEYRATAPYRVGFREDFRDETLLGFIFVFLLVPVAMMQAHEGAFAEQLFKHADNQPFEVWFGFFGVELAKAVPIVDWSEIYGVTTNPDTIEMEGTASRHAVFLARVTVDLLLIASLLQALGIATRNRQQKRLYSARHIDRLDPFVERIEIDRAIRASASAGMDAVELQKLRQGDLVDFRRYNEDRLRQIYGSTSNKRTRGFIEAIAAARGMPLVNAIELTIEIAQGHKNEFEMVQSFQRAIIEHENGENVITADDLYLILSELRSITGLRDFKRKVMEFMLDLDEHQVAIDRLIGLAGGAKADGFLYARDVAVEIVGKLAVKVTEMTFLHDVLRRLKELIGEKLGPRERATKAVIVEVEQRIADLGRAPQS